jgi:hypothetical protein
MAPPSSTNEHRMLGIESSEATFLVRQLLLRVQQLHMNPRCWGLFQFWPTRSE